MSEERKNTGLLGNPQGQYYYGTFQGVANYYPPFPQRIPQQVVVYPPAVSPPGSAPTSAPFYGYQAGYGPVAGCPMPDIENGYVREHSLPFCGIGMGWLLFFLGFAFGGLPWYLGTFILLCVRVDHREKPGYVACAIGTVVALIAVTFGATKGAHPW